MSAGQEAYSRTIVCIGGPRDGQRVPFRGDTYPVGYRWAWVCKGQDEDACVDFYAHESLHVEDAACIAESYL